VSEIGRTYSTHGRDKKHVQNVLDKPKGRDLGIDRRVELKEECVRLWTFVIWLRMGSSCGLFWTLYWIFEFQLCIYTKNFYLITVKFGDFNVYLWDDYENVTFLWTATLVMSKK